jgi:hypothetical protein
MQGLLLSPKSECKVYFCHQNQNARSTFVTKIRMQKDIDSFTTQLKSFHFWVSYISFWNFLKIWRLYWNPITLVFIWKVLRQAFRSYYYFWNPSTFEWVASLFEIFSKYLQSWRVEGCKNIGPAVSRLWMQSVCTKISLPRLVNLSEKHLFDVLCFNWEVGVEWFIVCPNGKVVMSQLIWVFGSGFNDGNIFVGVSFFPIFACKLVSVWGIYNDFKKFVKKKYLRSSCYVLLIPLSSLLSPIISLPRFEGRLFRATETVPADKRYLSHVTEIVPVDKQILVSCNWIVPADEQFLSCNWNRPSRRAIFALVQLRQSLQKAIFGFMQLNSSRRWAIFVSCNQVCWYS